MSDNQSSYHIVYPRGDKSKLKVIELSWSCEHELSDYSVASKQKFSDVEDARTYAKELAQKHSKEYVHGDDEPDYLD